MKEKSRVVTAGEWVDDHIEIVVVAGILAIIVGLLVWFIPAAQREQQAWEDHCVQVLHGRVVSKDATTVGFSTKDGSTIVSPKTDYYCLSPSGGILDIR